MSDSTGDAFSHLVGVLARLRDPGGCPWDQEQTHDSLKRSLLEESYEVLEAIDNNVPARLTEELGDVLLQVLFHAQIAAEVGDFTVDDVVESLRDKLVRRHPHVFGDTTVKDAQEVEANWERLKQQERENEMDRSALGNVPASTPALAYAQLIQDRASRAGFDFDGIDGVLDKVVEEIREMEEASSQEERAGEFGDLLFTLVNVGRWMGIHAEDALRQANARFYGRFLQMERIAGERGVSFPDMSMRQKEELWQQAKAQLR